MLGGKTKIKTKRHKKGNKSLKQTFCADILPSHLQDLNQPLVNI
jgi:hypothetical protein